jgi:hypothetical protein
MENWTGSLSHIGAMKSANPDSIAYHRCDSVDSDIVDYVNSYEMDDDNRVNTVRRAQKKKSRTPLPQTLPQSPWSLVSFEPDIINKPLPSAPLLKNVEADMETTEMVIIGVPKRELVAVLPLLVPPSQIKREYKEHKETIKRILWRTRHTWVSYNDGLTS